MLERLARIMAESRGQSVELSENMDLVKDLGLSSIDMVQMVVSIEEEFGIEISDRALKEIATVGDLVRVIEQQQ